MFATLFHSPHLLGNLDLAVVFAVTAAAIYLNDHLPVLLRNHRLFHRFAQRTTPSDFYWPAALALVGCLMLGFVVCQMAVSSLFVLGYGMWLIHRVRSLVRT